MPTSTTTTSALRRAVLDRLHKAGDRPAEWPGAVVRAAVKADLRPAPGDPTPHIVMLCAPCQGFGDVVYARKIAGLLCGWYPSARVLVASPQPDLFYKLGPMPRGSTVEMLLVSPGTSPACRKFGRLRWGLRGGKGPEAPDLVLVSPLPAGFQPDLADVRALVPSATRHNTVFMSEYNCDLEPGPSRLHCMQVGLGGDRMGLLFGDAGGGRACPQPLRAAWAYTVAYVAHNTRATLRCLHDFLELATQENRAPPGKEFHIVVPALLAVNLAGGTVASLAKRAGFTRAVIVPKEGKVRHVLGGGGGGGGGTTARTLVLRGDVLPLPYEEMNALLNHAAADVLITGDQSLSDALACKGKRVWYQVMPWKANLARRLAEQLDRPELASNPAGSCGDEGTLTLLASERTRAQLVRDWDFAKLSRPLFDALVALAVMRRSRGEEWLPALERATSLRGALAAAGGAGSRTRSRSRSSRRSRRRSR